MNAQIDSGSKVSPWTDAMLNSARQQGDEIADGLAETIFCRKMGLTPTASRLGYNALVDLADVLAAHPELFLVDDSRVRRCFEAFPPELQRYYDPLPAPSWVDPSKLQIASHLWTENSLAMLGILYAASLPACYLIANGIPALYDTEKLREQKYIFQRIYETGLMLDAVMDPEGLRIITDTPPDDPEHTGLVQTLNALDPSGRWSRADGKIVRSAGDGGISLNLDRVRQALHHHHLNEGTGRYIWGPGYIAAKKVRLLHASMRYMLLHPPPNPPPEASISVHKLADRLRQRREPWPTEKVGVPVNQEDLAYTLLTFAYLLPKGLEHWGCRVSLEQKEAFLHLWRVVGHVMGLRDDLLTDRWPDAERLYQIVLQRQGRQSPAGVALTEAVAEFLKSYLPSCAGLRERLPYTLIVDQLGPLAKDLLESDHWHRANDGYGAVLKSLGRTAVALYYRVYGVVGRFALADSFFDNLLHRTSEELVESWRDEYNREPFYVPTDLTTWELKRGVDPAFQEILVGWRQRLFWGIARAVASLGAGLLLLLGAVLARFLWAEKPAWVIGAVGLLLLVTSIWQMRVGLPRLFNQRPRLAAVRIRAGRERRRR